MSMRRLVFNATAQLALIILLMFLFGPANAQGTPTPVTPGYQICNTNSGSTQCSFQAVDAAHPLPVTTSGGGTSDVNIANVNGSAPSLTNPLPTANNPYPAGATPFTASATGTTAATVATLTAASGKTTYICGFTITSTATAALSGAATVTGTVTGTLNYVQGVGATPAVGTLSQNFTPCVPSSAVNTAIAVNSVAAGTGGVTAVSAWGYRQ